MRQRKEQYLENYRDDYNGNAIVPDILIEKLECVEKWVGYYGKPPEVKRFLKFISLSLENIDVLGTYKDAVCYGICLPWINSKLRRCYC